MPGYVTVEEVASEFRGATFSETSVPKASKVQQLIDQATAQINGVVGMRYELPIPESATDALAILKGVCLQLAVARVRPLLVVRTQAGAKGSQEPGEDDSRKEAEKILDQIAKNTLQLSGAVRLSAGGGVDSGNVRAGYKPGFKRDGNSW